MKKTIINKIGAFILILLISVPSVLAIDPTLGVVSSGLAVFTLLVSAGGYYKDTMDMKVGMRTAEAHLKNQRDYYERRLAVNNYKLNNNKDLTPEQIKKLEWENVRLRDNLIKNNQYRYELVAGTAADLTQRAEQEVGDTAGGYVLGELGGAIGGKIVKGAGDAIKGSPVDKQAADTLGGLLYNLGKKGVDMATADDQKVSAADTLTYNQVTGKREVPKPIDISLMNAFMANQNIDMEGKTPEQINAEIRKLVQKDPKLRRQFQQLEKGIQKAEADAQLDALNRRLDQQRLDQMKQDNLNNFRKRKLLRKRGIRSLSDMDRGKKDKRDKKDKEDDKDKDDKKDKDDSKPPSSGIVCKSYKCLPQAAKTCAPTKFRSESGSGEFKVISVTELRKVGDKCELYVKYIAGPGGVTGKDLSCKFDMGGNFEDCAGSLMGKSIAQTGPPPPTGDDCLWQCPIDWVPKCNGKIVDKIVPGGDGYQVQRKCKSTHPACPVREKILDTKICLTSGKEKVVPDPPLKKLDQETDPFAVPKTTSKDCWKEYKAEEAKSKELINEIGATKFYRHQKSKYFTCTNLEIQEKKK